ncbi:MAG: cytochrome c maturation protein CcmE [Gammaproteobacteria bacterium]
MKPKRAKQLFKIVFSLLITSLGLGLILYAFQANINLFLRPEELLKASPEIYKKSLKLGGYVLSQSIQKKSGLDLEFKITDFKKNITVKYQGILPDLFRENQGVIALGYWDSKEEIFRAHKILAKHDENYKPPT